MHSFFLSNTSMQLAQVNLMAKKPPSAKTNQSMGGSIYKSKGCARTVNFILFLQLTIVIKIMRKAKPSICVRQFPKERKIFPLSPKAARKTEDRNKKAEPSSAVFFEK